MGFSKKLLPRSSGVDFTTEVLSHPTELKPLHEVRDCVDDLLNNMDPESRVRIYIRVEKSPKVPA